MGIFLSPSIGFNWLNAKRKTILIAEVYADLGLTTMLGVNVNYEYGTYSNPQKYKKVDNMILNSNGSSIGLRVGVPIKVLKN